MDSEGESSRSPCSESDSSIRDRLTFFVGGGRERDEREASISSRIVVWMSDMPRSPLHGLLSPYSPHIVAWCGLLLAAASKPDICALAFWPL
ncbi:hypothetical protein GDO78_005706 [Eleutherodactylus coqui]|uniref:Uncharacterized protein n=1 Tax=Eleutherodactylus coqui TaxID=57060 RepID=A0A8J6KF44_ELECQ|nr:hypothetical protein GDO78_005706 [Eleutherodactylus coqui]